MSALNRALIVATMACALGTSAESANAKNYRYIESEIRSAASSGSRTRKPAPHAVAKSTADYQTGNIDRTKAGNPAKYQTGNIDRTKAGNPAKYQTGNIDRTTTGNPAKLQTGNVDRTKTGNPAKYQTGNIDRTNTK